MMVWFIFMANIKNKGGLAGPAAERSALTQPQASDNGPWGPYGASWAVTFAVLATLCLVFVSGPMSRIGFRYSGGYNEGNAAYFTRQAFRAA